MASESVDEKTKTQDESAANEQNEEVADDKSIDAKGKEEKPVEVTDKVGLAGLTVFSFEW